MSIGTGTACYAALDDSGHVYRYEVPGVLVVPESAAASPLFILAFYFLEASQLALHQRSRCASFGTADHVGPTVRGPTAQHAGHCDQ